MATRVLVLAACAALTSWVSAQEPQGEDNNQVFVPAAAGVQASAGAPGETFGFPAQVPQEVVVHADVAPAPLPAAPVGVPTVLSDAGHEVAAAEHGAAAAVEHEVAGAEHGAHGEPSEGAHGEHGESGGHGEDGGFEDEDEDLLTSPVNAGISTMLIGSVIFVMVLFELTKSKYPAVRKNTWLVLSATISIFSSVLIFQGCHGMLEAYLVHPLHHAGYDKLCHVIVFLQALIWFLLLQFVLALVCGVVKVPCYDPDYEHPEHMEKRVKTFGILLGHISGFAAITAFAHLQQKLAYYGAWAVILVAPIAWVFIVILGKATDFVRETAALMDDGVKSKHEELWDECAEDTEDDMIGLTVSFSFILGVRFAISGVMANAEGEEKEHDIISHNRMESMTLFAVGLCLVAIEGVRVMLQKGKSRFNEQARNVTGMTFSWSIYYSVSWVLARNYFSEETSMISAVVLALTVTVIALFLILGLLFAEWNHRSNSDASAVLRAIINAIGILIGFAWEKTFDHAVAQMSASVVIFDKPFTKMVMALACILVVTPSWYRHIMPTIIEYEEAERKEKEEEGGKRELDLKAEDENSSSEWESDSNEHGALKP